MSANKIDSLPEGWSLAFDGKWHYFPKDDTQSLCRRVGFHTNKERELGNDESEDNCKGCKRELYKIKREKAYRFVRHIEKHLAKMPEITDKRAHCKICNKDIDTIDKEEKANDVL